MLLEWQFTIPGFTVYFIDRETKAEIKSGSARSYERVRKPSTFQVFGPISKQTQKQFQSSRGHTYALPTYLEHLKLCTWYMFKKWYAPSKSVYALSIFVPIHIPPSFISHNLFSGLNHSSIDFAINLFNYRTPLSLKLNSNLSYIFF